MSDQQATRIALVTGANRGLGLEASRQLASQGVHVIMAGRSADKIEAAAKPLRDEGLPVDTVVLDVTDADQRAAVRAKLEAEHGRLDILINNAGAIFDPSGFMANSSRDVPLDVLRKTFEVNTVAVVGLTQELVGLIEKSEAGRIVNVSSIMGSLTVASQPGEMIDYKPLAYNASKAALNMFTVCLAADLRKTPIKVNSAHPGWVKTDMGSEHAPMEIVEGAKTLVDLALLGEDGPSGSFVHLGDTIPW